MQIPGKPNKRKEEAEAASDKTMNESLGNLSKVLANATKKAVSDVDLDSVLAKLKINPEFEKRFQPLSDHQLSLLEADIKENGFKDPIEYIEFGEDYFVVDGHNRFKLYNKGATAKKPKLNKIEGLNSTSEIKEYIDKRQFDTRRNLSQAERMFHIGRKYMELSAEQKGLPKDKKINVAKSISEKFNISERSINNYRKIYSSIRLLQENALTALVARDILIHGFNDINQGDVVKIDMKIFDRIENELSTQSELVKTLKQKDKVETHQHKIRYSNEVGERINEILISNKAKMREDVAGFIDEKINELKKVKIELSNDE